MTIKVSANNENFIGDFLTRINDRKTVSGHSEAGRRVHAHPLSSNRDYVWLSTDCVNSSVCVLVNIGIRTPEALAAIRMEIPKVCIQSDSQIVVKQFLKI